MNLYDKRSKETIKSRVTMTRSEPVTHDGNTTISTQLHLDLGYILYLSSKEIEYISKAYKECLNNNTNDLPGTQADDLPGTQAEPPLDQMEE